MLYVVGMDDLNTLGGRIAYARLRGLNRMTQAQVAAEMGVTPQAVSNWERNEDQPELDKLGKLAEILGTNIMWLMKGVGEAAFEPYFKEIEQGIEKRKKDGALRKSPPLVGARDFPIYAASEGGDGFSIIHTDVVEYVRRPSLLEGVPDGYGVLVVGESMVPGYRPGDMALIHPGRPPTRDTDVVLYKGDRRTGDAASMIKRLVGFNDKAWKLEQYQPAKIFSVPRTDWPICHQVVGRYNNR